MRILTRVLASILAFTGMAGCRQSAPPPQSIEELINSHHGTPLDKSLKAVAGALANCEVLIPTDVIHEEGQPVRIRTAPDNRGKDWMYLYTGEAELLAVLSAGTPYVAMPFRNAFNIVAHDERFGGIGINFAENRGYLIPFEVFNIVEEELGFVSGPSDGPARIK